MIGTRVRLTPALWYYSGGSAAGTWRRVFASPETFPAHVVDLLRKGFVPRLGTLEIGAPEGPPACALRAHVATCPDPAGCALALLGVLRYVPAEAGATRNAIAEAARVTDGTARSALRALRSLGAIVESRPRGEAPRFALALGVADALRAEALR